MQDLYFAISAETLLTHTLDFYKNVHFPLMDLLQQHDDIRHSQELTPPMLCDLRSRYSEIALKLQSISGELQKAEKQEMQAYNAHLLKFREHCSLYQKLLSAEFACIDGLLKKAAGKFYTFSHYKKDSEKLSQILNELSPHIKNGELLDSYDALRALIDSPVLDMMELELK